MVSTVMFLGTIAGVAAVLYFALKRLSPVRHFAVAGTIFLLTWFFEFNSNLVLLRDGYCVGMPIWPPFIGHTIDIPRWIMPGVSLIAIASTPATLLAALGLWRTRHPQRTRRNVSVRPV